MTVAELIAWLEDQPLDATVHVQTGYDNWSGPEYSELDSSMLDLYKPWNYPEQGAQVTLANK